MSVRQTVPFLLAGALALAMAVGCGSDSSPTGGGGGGGSPTLSIPSGAYSASGEFFVCGETVPYDAQVDTLVYCSNDLVDEFFGYDCPVKRSGNNLSLSCERTREVSLGCTETVKLDIKGTVSGDHYELSGTFEYSDNPGGCFDGSYCDSLHLTLDRIGNKPPACTYAEANTVALNIVGGQQAGAHVLDATGFSNQSAGSFAFNFAASNNFASTAADAPAGGTGPTIYLNAQTSFIDPATLPATLPVVIMPPLARSAAPAGGPDVSLYYSEYASTYQFTAESVVSGNFVVHEIDADHIAGTLDVTIAGTEYSEANPEGTAAQRRLTGGYYVLGGSGPGANAAAQANPGALAQGMRRLAR